MTENRMDDGQERAWRDEERLPLSELERAMGAAASDGEVDDVTGSDAGAESAFGHGAEPADTPPAGHGTNGGREMTDNQRRYRPSTTGRTGPN
jgi:hypothetical protein